MKLVVAHDEGYNEVICDFCNLPTVAWRYPARDFHIEAVDWGSIGDWAACGMCAELIEAGDREGLATRTLTRFPYGDPSDPNLRSLVLDMHDQFREARIGDRKPV